MSAYMDLIAKYGEKREKIAAQAARIAALEALLSEILALDGDRVKLGLFEYARKKTALWRRIRAALGQETK